MTKQEKVKDIVNILEGLYPETPVPLNHSDNYTLLISVLLSAQCTDVRVNLTTPHLFSLADNPYAMVELTIPQIKEIIRPCGLSPMKSKAIWNLSELLINNHNGEVPESFEELEKLPGVGHKTASVVMAQGFNHPAFPVDTHIHRLIYRWGLSTGKNVKLTERDCKRLFDESLWNKLHLQIIFFGRAYCPARGHNPYECPICSKHARKTVFQQYDQEQARKLTKKKK